MYDSSTLSHNINFRNLSQFKANYTYINMKIPAILSIYFTRNALLTNK